MIDIDPIVFLQIKNAFITLLGVSMVGVFASILIADRANWRDVYWQACFFILVFLVGETAEQFWYWAWRHFASGNPAWLSDGRLFQVLGLNVVIAIGGIGIIKTFTAVRFGHRLWIVVLGLCLMLSVAALWLPK